MTLDGISHQKPWEPVHNIPQVLKENYELRIVFPGKICFQNEGEIRLSQVKELREYVSSIPTLKEWLTKVI